MPTPKTHAQLVDAAIADGRISPGSRHAFINALAADPDGTKRVLAAIKPLPPDVRLAIRKTPQTGSPSTATRTDPVDALYAKLTNPTGQPGPRNLISGYGAVTEPGQPEQVMQATTITHDAMNEKINSDPGMQRAMWDLGVRDGINKPPEHYEIFPNDDIPGTPKLVEHQDGSAHWETVSWPELR